MSAFAATARSGERCGLTEYTDEHAAAGGCDRFPAINGTHPGTPRGCRYFLS